MENKKLIDKDYGKGTYCILFRNFKGRELDEVEEIFSKFGTIHSVNVSGDKTGYCFIRYRHLNEAENAVEGIKSHPDIRLSFHQPKKNKENFKNKNSNDSYNMNHKQMQSPTQSMWNVNDSSSTHSPIKNSFDNSKNPNYKKNYKKNFSESNLLKNDNQTKYQKMLYSIQNDGGNNTLNDNDDGSISKTRQVFSETSLKTQKYVPKKIISIAEEVIVGNIHSKYGACYILHLFDKYEPIAITEIKVIEKSNIRYCHVYFKAKENAIAVENNFDQLKLLGQKLVVLRSCRLVSEGQ